MIFEGPASQNPSILGSDFGSVFDPVLGPSPGPPFEPTSARIKSSGPFLGTQGAESEKKRVPKWTPFWPKNHKSSSTAAPFLESCFDSRFQKTLVILVRKPHGRLSRRLPFRHRWPFFAWRTIRQQIGGCSFLHPPFYAFLAEPAPPKGPFLEILGFWRAPQNRNFAHRLHISGCRK